MGKRLQILKEAAPGGPRRAVPSPPFPATVLNLHEAQTAAPALSLTVLPMEVHAPDGFDNQFASMLRLGTDALLTAARPRRGVSLTHPGSGSHAPAPDRVRRAISVEAGCSLLL